MTGYPWQTGDELLAHDLNAAIANSIGLSSGTLPLNGSAPMTGPLTLAGNASLPLHAVPLQQLNAATAGGPFLPLTGGSVAHLNISNIPLANPDGSPPAGSIKGDLYSNGGFVCIAP